MPTSVCLGADGWLHEVEQRGGAGKMGSLDAEPLQLLLKVNSHVIDLNVYIILQCKSAMYNKQHA